MSANGAAIETDGRKTYAVNAADGAKPARPAIFMQRAPAAGGAAQGGLLCREPYRLLFPLGALLSWAGVVPWLLFGLGVTDDYKSIYHSMAQVQGFLACFAAGFLLTMIPRRTGTGPAKAWQVAVAAAAPIGATALAFVEKWALAQAFWMALLALLISFAASRFPKAKTPVPPSFVWVPFALAAGLAGAVLAGVGAAKGDDWFWLHDVGRGLVLQGVFGALIAGIGAALLPHLARGEGAPLQGRPDVRARVLHAGAATVFLASFFVEQLVDVRLGFALRALTAGGALVLEAKLWRYPRIPGVQRWLAWLGAWAMPVGLVLCAAFPAWRQIGLHTMFIGAFGTLALAIGAHVTLAHGGRLGTDRNARFALLGALFAAALAARALVVLDVGHYRLWVGLAAGCFLAGTLAWASIAAGALRAEAQH